MLVEIFSKTVSLIEESLVRIKYQVVRVHGSEQRYAPQPRKAPTVGKSVLIDSPEVGDKTVITFGAEISSQVLKYEKICRASAVLYVKKFFLGAEDLPRNFDDAIEHIVNENAQWFQGMRYEWYTSISIEREFEIDDSLILNTPSCYTWINHCTEDLPDIKSFHAKGKEELNALDTYISFVFGSHFIKNPIISRIILLNNSDEPVFLLPRLSGSASIGEPYTQELLNSGRFRDLLEEFKQRKRNVNKFKTIIKTRLLFIREEDDLKKFLYGFWSLETLINTVSDRAVESTRMHVHKGQSQPYLVEKLVKSLAKTNIQDKFEIMQIALNCKNTEDMEIFKRIAARRNNVAHGKFFDAELLSNISAIEKLLDKYLSRALEFDELPEVKIAFDT